MIGEWWDDRVFFFRTKMQHPMRSQPSLGQGSVSGPGFRFQVSGEVLGRCQVRIGELSPPYGGKGNWWWPCLKLEVEKANRAAWMGVALRVQADFLTSFHVAYFFQEISTFLVGFWRRFGTWSEVCLELRMAKLCMFSLVYREKHESKFSWKRL